MAAPRGATYTPRSGPLAGRTFVGIPGTSQAYNRYQQARAHTLGFSGYRQERLARQSTRYRQLIGQESRDEPVSRQRRFDLLKAFGQQQRIETVVEGGKTRRRYTLDVDWNDHKPGGSLDKYLQAIGRRNGTEDWNPGETP